MGAYKINSNTTYIPAQSILDFTPTFGEVEFHLGSNTSQLILNIRSSDSNNNTNLNKMFFIALTNIENCEFCQLGSIREANIYIRYSKPPSLMVWSSGPVVALNTSTTRICGTNSDRHLVRLAVELNVLDANKLPGVIIERIANRITLAENSSAVFVSPGKSECIYVVASIDNRK